MENKSDINVGLLVTLGAAGVLMLIVIVIAVQAWVDYQDRQVFTSELQQGPVVPPLVKLQEQQIQHIQTAHYDKDGKLTAIPIDQAMRILIDSGGKLPAAPMPPAGPTPPATAPRSTGAS